MGGQTLKITADTNVLVRAAVQDDPVQSQAAATMLREASLIAITTPASCEFVWVLLRAYKRSRSEIAAAIRHLLAAENVATDRPAVEMGLAFLEAGGDFADGIIAYDGSQLGAEVFVSFDGVALAVARKLGIDPVAPSV